MIAKLNFYKPKDLGSYLIQKEIQLDILLDIICQRLQLDNAREEKLQSAYKHITDCIEKDTFFDKHDALMYAFGSRALNTVVKPYKRKEYDLDFAVRIILSDINAFTPKQLVQKLYDCLNSDGTFSGKITPIRYGARIIYSGKFHVDIMLGILLDSERLLVPDWKDNKWVNRNPKGLIKWFESKYIVDYKNISLYEYYQQYYPNKFNKLIQIEERAETEDITPTVTYAEIQPIQSVTQLVKRHRDKYFLKNMPDYKTSSIILTTLIGDHYQNEKSIYDGMNGFIQRNFSLIETSGSIPFRLINPADRYLPENLQENLTDKWEKDKMYYKVFREYNRKLSKDWIQLHEKESIRKKAEFLQSIFGENIVKTAYKALNEHLRSLGLSYDHKPLVDIVTPTSMSPQAALASVSQNMKPYYEY